MNRVIKFRVYILDNKGKVECCFHEWLDGDGWKHDYYAPIVCNGVFSHEELGDGFLGEIVRKQYIGLTDKNGVEIYEGDVLKSESWGKGSKSKNPYHVVVWGECGWKAQGYNGQMKVYPDLTVRKDFEVIGNIFENPKLLNP